MNGTSTSNHRRLGVRCLPEVHTACAPIAVKRKPSAISMAPS